MSQKVQVRQNVQKVPMHLWTFRVYHIAGIFACGKRRRAEIFLENVGKERGSMAVTKRTQQDRCYIKIMCTANYFTIVP